MARHLRTLVRGQLIRRSKAETTPMHVKHDRSLASQVERPDVQLEHVFALPTVVPVEEEGLLDACPGMEILRAVRAIRQSRVLVRPWLGRPGRQPAILFCSGSPVWHTFEPKPAAIQYSAQFAMLGIRNRRQRDRSVARLLMYSRL